MFNKAGYNAFMRKRKADYGIEHIWMVLALSALGVLLLFLSTFFLPIAFLVLGLILLLVALVVFYLPSRIGKLLLRDDVLRLLPLDREKLILDVGTGRGLLALGLAKSLKEGHVYGIDISTEALAHAAENAEIEGVSNHTTFQHGDAREIPFPDKHFDLVVTNLLMSAVPKSRQEEVLKELCRVTKFGGTIIISDVLVGRYGGTIKRCGVEEVLIHRPRKLTNLFFFPARAEILLAKKQKA